MKHKLLCAAAALALTAAAESASAQGGPQPDVLPPHEIVTIVRSTGLNPLERPVRRGNTYVFRAMGAGGQEMRVTVDARYGDVMAVSPVANVRPGLAPPGMTMGPYERVDRDDDDAGPQRLSPPGIYGSRPPPIGEVDDDEPIIYAPGARPQAPGTVRPPAPVTSAPLAPPPGGQQPFSTQQQRMQTSAPPPPPASIAPPPAPMPSTASVGEPQPITQPGEGGLLPPPPERFPQRVAPSIPAAAKSASKPAQQTSAQQPKPVKQKTAASSSAPAKPPLPKSKPVSPGATPAPSTPAAAAPQAKPAADAVPH